MDWKAFWKKTWHFIWHEDSIWSWIANVLLAFIIIKFLFYPAVGLLLGTQLPVVAVVSGSMEHKTVQHCIQQGSYGCEAYAPNVWQICGKEFDERQKVNFDFFWQTCGPWYEEINLTKEEFSSFRFRNGFNTGDIMVLVGVEPQEVNAGDVLVYATQRYPYPIIHRVVDVGEFEGKYFYMLKGDHNEREDEYVGENQILGKAVIKIPYLGYIKIFAVKAFSYVAGGFNAILS